MRNIRGSWIGAGCAVAIAVIAFASAHAALPSRRARAYAAMRPRISADSAQVIALARVAGKVKSRELEKEHGRLIYSFDIVVEGKSGIQEVNVDARTGKIVSVEHESAAEEKHEDKDSGSH